MAGKSLTFLLFGEDVTAGKAFRKVGTEAEAAHGKISKSFGPGSAVAFGGLAIGLGASAKAAIDFNSKMLLLHTQAGVSMGAVNSLSKSVIAMSGSVATGPNALADSMYHVASTGLKGAQALDAVKISAEGARVGNSDLEQTTNALTAAVASGIPGVQDMQQAMGALNAVVGAGDMRMSDLTEAMGTGFLSVVKQYGLNLADVGAALATFGDNNIRGADAATALRMAVQAISKPAATAKEALKRIGLTSTQLRDDMAKHGLNFALTELQGHLKAAGVSSQETGAILTEIFGKKAGVGLAVLIGQYDRFEQKIKAVGQGANTFGADWNAWLKSDAGQIDQLKAKTQQFEVQFGEKLLPVISTGIGLVNDHSTAVLELAGGLLGLKVAISGVKLAQDGWNAATAVGTGIQKVFGQAVVDGAAKQAAAVEASDAKQVAANDAVAASQGRAAVSGRLLGLGIIGVGLAAAAAAKQISNAEEKNDAFAQSLFHGGIATHSLTTALVNNNGALDDNVKSIVQAAAAHVGLVDKAAQAGITTDQLTGAITGNKDALAALIDQWKASGKPSDATIAGLMAQWAAYHSATDAAGKHKAAAEGVAGSEGALTPAIAAATKELKAQALAALDLSAGLSTLNSRGLDVKDAELSFLDSLDSVTAAVKQNGRSLSDNTAAGRANQEAFLGSIKLAQAHAVAMQKGGQSAANAARDYLKDEAALRKSAIAAGLNRDQVDALIRKYGQVPKDIRTQIDVEDAAARAKVAAFNIAVGKLPKSIQTEVRLNGLATAEYELQLLARNRTANVNIQVAPHTIGVRSVGGVQVVGATGAIVNGPTRALIGEAGPEAVIPLNRTKGNRALPASWGSGGGNTYLTINFPEGVMFADPHAAGRAIVGAIATHTKNGGKLIVAGRAVN